MRIHVGNIKYIWSFYHPLILNGRGLSLHWGHNERDCVSNHRLLHCLLKRLFRRRSQKTSTGHLERNPSVTGGFPSQRVRNVENVSIKSSASWWKTRRRIAYIARAMAAASLAPWHQHPRYCPRCPKSSTRKFDLLHSMTDRPPHVWYREFLGWKLQASIGLAKTPIKLWKTWAINSYTEL